MTTITHTTAAAVSRKLKSLNFERFDGNVGYEVIEAKSDRSPITIIHRVYGDYGFQMALELQEAGYAVTCDKVDSWRSPEISVQLVQVYGKITKIKPVFSIWTSEGYRIAWAPKFSTHAAAEAWVNEVGENGGWEGLNIIIAQEDNEG